MTFLDSRDLLCALQHGFWFSISTEAALLDVVKYVTENIDRGLMRSLVTADTSRTFDSVDCGA